MSESTSLREAIERAIVDNDNDNDNDNRMITARSQAVAVLAVLSDPPADVIAEASSALGDLMVSPSSSSNGRTMLAVMLAFLSKAKGSELDA